MIRNLLVWLNVFCLRKTFRFFVLPWDRSQPKQDLRDVAVIFNNVDQLVVFAAELRSEHAVSSVTFKSASPRKDIINFYAEPR